MKLLHPAPFTHCKAVRKLAGVRLARSQSERWCTLGARMLFAEHMIGLVLFPSVEQKLGVEHSEQSKSIKALVYDFKSSKDIIWLIPRRRQLGSSVKIPPRSCLHVRFTRKDWKAAPIMSMLISMECHWSFGKGLLRH